MKSKKLGPKAKGVNLMYAENEIRIAILWLKQRSPRYAGVGRCYRLTRGGTGPSQFRAWVALATGARFPLE